MTSVTLFAWFRGVRCHWVEQNPESRRELTEGRFIKSGRAREGTHDRGGDQHWTLSGFAKRAAVSAAPVSLRKNSGHGISGRDGKHLGERRLVRDGSRCARGLDGRLHDFIARRCGGRP